MKDNYVLANGKAVEVEVTPGQAQALKRMKTEQESYERKFKRRNSRETSLEHLNDEYEWEPADETVDVFEAVVQRLEAERVREAVATLSEKQREIVRLYFYEGKTVREIALVFSISHQAVSKQLAAIILGLKNKLEFFRN
jgi:RNA polymerase sigma factor for flagellar operon FliA